jgi:hypothetical protein
VRQFDVPRTYPPTWTDELRMATLWPDRRWAPPTATNIVWATSEMYGWLTDQREYDGQHKPGWLSALADLKDRLLTAVNSVHTYAPRSAVLSPQQSPLPIVSWPI